MPMRAAGKITVGIRPEDLSPEPAGIPEPDRLALTGRLIRYEPGGGRILLYLRHEDQILRALVSADIRARVNETVTVWTDLRRCHYFDERGGRLLF